MRKIFLLFSLIFSLFFTFEVYAQGTDDLSKQLQDKQAEIRKLEEQLQQTRSTEKSLKSQLTLIDGQTKVTTLKIEETNLKIAKLKREINDLSGRIDRISTNLDVLSEILLKRIVQTYKYSNSISTLDLLFSSHGFADLIEKLKYVQVAQAFDKKKLYELQATKIAYNEQKQDKQTRQVEAEKLNKELANYKAQLIDQKKAKDELLSVTKNDEATYQGLIAQLQAEINSISQAISNVGVAIGPVKKGEPIPGALLGSTGCSTGPHLHFEVYENAKVEGSFVRGTKTDPQTYMGSGTLGPPLIGFPGFDWIITTGYNQSYEVFGYKSYHTGLDIALRGGGGVGRPIIAAADGIAYPTSGTCKCYIEKTCNQAMMSGGSGVGKGVIVDHQNGLVTLYWHIL